MSLPYPGIPGYPYPPLSPCVPVRQWPTSVIVLVIIVVITLVGWTPPEILRLLTLLHAAG